MKVISKWLNYICTEECLTVPAKMLKKYTYTAQYQHLYVTGANFVPCLLIFSQICQ